VRSVIAIETTGSWSDRTGPCIHETVSIENHAAKAHDAQMRGRAPSDWVTWLTRVAINTCHDRRRAGWWMHFRSSSARGEEIQVVAAADPSPADRALSEETRHLIWLAFRKLPERQRQVFVLRYIEDLSTAEVAATLGLSPGSVKRHLFRAIHRLRESLRGAS
jgi:RNA polymerase sigma-70 factor (ECF subfamily)